MSKEKVLIVGNGGREHAIGELLRRHKLFFAPGNGGTEQIGKNIQINPTDVTGLSRFAVEEKITLAVVGPETALEKGVVNELNKNKVSVFGPTREAARIETNKAWATAFMHKYNIPTPFSHAFSDSARATKFVNDHWEQFPFVVKASGLAAGKGVVIPHTKEEALRAVRDMLISKKFGQAGAEVVLQEKVAGQEISVMAFVDGNQAVPIIPIQDHKGVYEGGPNTGGMGTYGPVPFITSSDIQKIHTTILQPTVEGLAQEGCPFKGILFAGLMLTQQGPTVLEFNARPGDPETQVGFSLLQGDLTEILHDCINGTLKKEMISFQQQSAVCVVLTSYGYPEKYETGFTINGLTTVKNLHPHVKVFHASTILKNGKLVTAGGRVLGVTGFGKDLSQAIAHAYNAIGLQGIHFHNMYYRHDIGLKALSTSPTTHG